MRQSAVLAALGLAGLVGAEYLAIAIAVLSVVIAIWSHIRLGRRIADLAEITSRQAALSRAMSQKARRVDGGIRDDRTDS